MYHGRFKGSHYDCGFRWGTLLRKNNKIIANQHTFVVSEERKEFAKQCLPIYEKYYPEILDEIKGIADGQQTSYEDMLTFLLSMYCFEFNNKCTCMAISDKNQIILGRNSDFLVELEKLYMNCLYNLDNCYSFNGNTTAFVEMEDGINEYGLAIGMTFIYPQNIMPGINAGMIVRYILERCQTLQEAIQFIKSVPIASNQTITIADALGNIAIVECNSQNVVVIYPLENENFVTTANNFNSSQMKKYNEHNIDDWNSSLRHQIAYQSLKNNDLSMELIFDILSGKHGFMCQYDRRKGADTVWSVVYDIKNKKIYRVEGNPSRKQYQEDHRFKFSY